MLGESGRPDATEASGGAVRAYEPRPEQRRLATASMVELLSSQTLREWADYRHVDSVYLRERADGLAADVADIELALPGSARLVPAAELAALGWSGVPDGAMAVLERRAGYTSPGRLREAILADGAVRRRVCVQSVAVGAITLAGHQTVVLSAGGRLRDYDVVVVATGAWTARLLESTGLPADGYRTKSIQYAIHPTGDWRPPQFVDEITGLYGRPAVDGGLLLGLPTQQWDVDPHQPPATPALHEAAAGLAAARFPKLRLGPATHQVASADCYADDPTLSLRFVVDTGHQLFTFTGGSGGAAKTALAASHRAAVQVVESGAAQPARAGREPTAANDVQRGPGRSR